MQTASQLKQDGITFYKSGNFQKAIQSYQRSLALQKDETVFYNCSLAYFQLKKYELCIHACEEALSLNPLYVKALYRKITCLKELNKPNDIISEGRRFLRLASSMSEDQNFVNEVSNLIRGAKTQLNTQATHKIPAAIRLFDRSLLQVPTHISQISELAHVDGVSIQTLNRYLVRVQNESTKNYTAQKLIELEYIRNQIYRKILSVETDILKQHQVLQILVGLQSTKLEAKQQYLQRIAELGQKKGLYIDALGAARELYYTRKEQKEKAQIDILRQLISKNYEKQAEADLKSGIVSQEPNHKQSVGIKSVPDREVKEQQAANGVQAQKTIKKEQKQIEYKLTQLSTTSSPTLKPPSLNQIPSLNQSKNENQTYCTPNRIISHNSENSPLKTIVSPNSHANKNLSYLKKKENPEVSVEQQSTKIESIINKLKSSFNLDRYAELFLLITKSTAVSPEEKRVIVQSKIPSLQGFSTFVAGLMKQEKELINNLLETLSLDHLKQLYKIGR